MNTKTRVGALFLIFSLVNISFAQKIPPIDSMNDNVIDESNPYLKILPETTTNLPELQDRFELVAKTHPELSLLEALAPISTIVVFGTINEVVFWKNFEQLKKRADYQQLKLWSDKIKKPLEIIKSDYDYMIKNTSHQISGHMVNQEAVVAKLTQRSVQALEDLMMIAQDMAQSPNPFIKNIATELSQIDDIVKYTLNLGPTNPITTAPSAGHMMPREAVPLRAQDIHLSSAIESTQEATVRQLAARRVFIGNNVINQLNKSISRVHQQAHTLDALRAKRNFGAILAGAAVGVVIVTYDYLVESADNQTSFLNTKFKDVSVDMRNEFLLMLTDTKRGLGLTFAQAGQALDLLAFQ